ncbi:hypothetical protein [Roseicitreum antarcticum]|nr:hypothetical protein [Roseicitreum antarcticum]
MSLLSACGLLGRCDGAEPLDDAARAALYQVPLPAPDDALSVFHLGHSLVGRDMPGMVQQLAQAVGLDAHRYDSQLGWGTPLRAHWEPDVAINGFAQENDHPRYRDAAEALRSGEYNAFVMTEMVELRDAIAHHDSAEYLRRWAGLAREHQPDVRIYLYETWHYLDDPAGWLNRLDTDPGALWEGELLARALAAAAADPPAPLIHVIPAGRVMAAFVRALEGQGGLRGMADRSDLFARMPDGSLDPIHINDVGAYLVALTHYAVLYHRDPLGLPHALRRADGTLADAPSAPVAALMQQVVWDVVTSLPVTGVGDAQ